MSVSEPLRPCPPHEAESAAAAPNRRRLPRERRRASRSGRRSFDPLPACAVCGLPVADRPHASERDCIAALREEVERLRALLDDPIDRSR